MTSPSGKSNSTLALRIREEHVSDHQRKLPETAMGSTRPTGPNHRNVTGIQNGSLGAAAAISHPAAVIQTVGKRLETVSSEHLPHKIPLNNHSGECS